ncbi:SIR2 family NAD-dependent protein deacylase [Collimonas fungivorans]|uniref:SIR2 family NAD-dependent protein deacylase n=1 Tax=Collimonas fungivorans TaxID=158899 RepID=UPI003FA3BB74
MHTSSDIPTGNNSRAVVNEMAALLASHKLVPFLGAGISRQHLGLAAAELARKMAEEIDHPPEMLLADLADIYLETRGETAFVEFLTHKLVVTDLDERKAPSHRLLVSLMQNVLYTTNQDNLFELVAAKYGRHYRSIITVEDLSESIPGEPLLIKFHGDTTVPGSLVFGTKSYQARMEEPDHPLDIRLKSDLLGKRLMFLGYSLNDENVAKIFATVARIFKGTLPSSYLVAFDDDPALIETARKYQVKVIIPPRLFPDAENNAEAFERFLQLLCDETRILQIKRGTEDILSGGTFNPHIVTDYEVRSITKIVQSEPFDVAVDAFRKTFDSARAPEYLEQEITNLFVELIGRADPTSPDQMTSIAAALFNFRISPIAAFSATATLMAACNKRPLVRGFDNYMLISPTLPKGCMPVAAAAAVAILDRRNEAITESFRRSADLWFRQYKQAPENLKGQIVAAIQVAWPGTHAAGSPLHNQFPTLGGDIEFHDILNDILEKFPKRPSYPEE